jgi:transposase
MNLKMVREMGRPTKYKPEMCETVIELMKEGASQYEVLATLGISEDTFYRWKKENEEFSESIKRGSQLSQAWWEKKGRISLDDRQFNSTLWYMNMKNRFKWADKQEVKNEGNVTIVMDTGIDHYPGEQDE